MTTTEIVSVRGQYLYNADGTRFFIKGIAFPVPLLTHDYNATAWIAILHQLKEELQLVEMNTVRLYSMDPTVDYSAFFDAAASLGIYIIVPLTSVSGGGVLDRRLEAPECYSRKLFQYGIACLKNYLQYPNALAGIVGNEVMNSLRAWKAAPCIKAYVRDLKLYIEHHFDRSLPLMYTAQDAGIGAAVSASEVMRLTANYLSCTTTTNGDRHTSIDIFGVNVESWCSSKSSFERNEDGSVGSYYALWEELHNASVALVFAEMGCPHALFNRDNDVVDKARDWRQVPVVLNEMADTWSGFCAYAYDGNIEFNMFEGGPWNGRDPLVPTTDFFNFRDQLNNHHGHIPNVDINTAEPRRQPACSSIDTRIRTCCDYVFRDNGIEIYNIDNMPSYYTRKASDSSGFGSLELDAQILSCGNNLFVTHHFANILFFIGVLASTMCLGVVQLVRKLKTSTSGSCLRDAETSMSLIQVQYQSIN